MTLLTQAEARTIAHTIEKHLTENAKTLKLARSIDLAIAHLRSPLPSVQHPVTAPRGSLHPVYPVAAVKQPAASPAPLTEQLDQQLRHESIPARQPLRLGHLVSRLLPRIFK